MKDRYWVALIVAGVLGWIAVIHFFLVDRRPWAIVGAPPGAQCSQASGDGVRTCVVDGVAYTCVTDWSDRVITCGQRRLQ